MISFRFSAKGSSKLLRAHEQRLGASPGIEGLGGKRKTVEMNVDYRDRRAYYENADAR